MTPEEERLIRARCEHHREELAVADRRHLLAALDDERAKRAAVWDEGHAVATDDFLHSDYCGRRCKCGGLAGTTNPYKETA